MCTSVMQQQIVTGQDGQTSLQNRRNLANALKQQVPDKLKLGQSNRDSMYYRSWRNVQPFSSPKCRLFLPTWDID